ncbi:GHKL domain-containing protein [Euzebyella marina]|uniref:GHKL domain-containing protein n=2 Tax=Euzebyella marina TaxID=1761453 RepID=A0A3G2L5D0_9FLAO|nr:GHKL domain-containing protein [Euzebyella marina]
MMNFNFNIPKKYRNIIPHIVVWGILILLPFLFAWMRENESPLSDRDWAFLYLNSFMLFFWMLFFYLNTQVIIPKLLFRGKYLLFILLQLIMYLGVLGVRRLVFHLFVSDSIEFQFLGSAWHNSIVFLLTTLVSIIVKTVQDRAKTEQLVQEANNETLKSELSFLRTQISPHFLFNVLNNMVAMARLKSNQLEPTIHKLSSIMKYMLYQTEEKVLLKSEIEYLKSYIELQQLRIGDRLQLNLNIHEIEDWHTIEPMLLIPFVENAFKHGTGMLKKPEIAIHIISDKGRLHFEVKNRYETQNTTKDGVSGIGLANVKRRLQLLYDGMHELEIDSDGEWFKVDLKLTYKS